MSDINKIIHPEYTKDDKGDLTEYNRKYLVTAFMPEYGIRLEQHTIIASYDHDTQKWSAHSPLIGYSNPSYDNPLTAVNASLISMYFEYIEIEQVLLDN